MRTLGISPKVSVPTILALLAAIVFFAMGANDTGQALLAAAAGVAATGWAAPPGTVTPDVEDFAGDVRNPQAGYSLIEAAIALLIFAVAIVILLRVL